MMGKLEASSFSLLLKLKVFHSDIQYPTNAVLEIALHSGDFSGSTLMDIDIKEFKRFFCKLNDLYETLHGSAAIAEPYGKQMIQFSSDPSGHIHVTGMICNGGQSLQFENSFDQTFLKPFVSSLKEILS